MTSRLPLVALSLLLAGCGTTVSVGSAPSGESGVGGLSGVAPGAPTGSAPGVTVPGAGRGAVPGGSTAAGSAGSTAGGSSSTGSRPGTAPTSAASAPPASVAAAALGVTASSISVGIETFAGYQQAGQSFGVGGLANQTAETKENAQRVVDYINKHGGIAGRKLVPVYHDTNIDSNETWDNDEQATCASFTEDNHVFAAVTPEGFDYDTLPSCLAKRNTILLRESVNLYDQKFADRFPGLYYQPADVLGNRWAVFVDSLVNQGFFQKGSRVGIIRATWPEEARTAQLLRQELAKHGIQVVDEIAEQDEASTTAVGNTLAGMSNAVLRFRSDRVDHVLFTQGPVFPFGFMTNAESQEYRPAYGLTSRVNLSFIQSNAPAAQLKTARGITFNGLPSRSLDNSATRLCKSDAIGPSGLVNPYCNELLFLAAALGRAPSLDVGGFVAGVRALGKGFVSPFALATNLAAHYQDGGAAARPFDWDGSCGCFNYAGNVFAVP